MKRVRLDKSTPEDRIAELERDLRLAQDALLTANHEIRTIQEGYRGLVRRAEANAAAKARKQVEIEFTKELQSMNFRLAEMGAERDNAVKQLGLQARGFYDSGPNHSCPECGCIIRPVPLLEGKQLAPAKRQRVKLRAD